MNREQMKKRIIEALDTGWYEDCFYCQRGSDFVFGNRAFVVRLRDVDMSQYRLEEKTVELAEKAFETINGKDREWRGAAITPPSISLLKKLIRAHAYSVLVLYRFTASLCYNAQIMLPILKLLGNCKMDFRRLPGYSGYGKNRYKTDAWALYLVGDRGEAIIMPYGQRQADD